MNRQLVSAGLTLTLLTSLAVSGFAQKGAEFSLRSLDGQTVGSSALRGKAVVLAFGASWLPLSRNQLQGLKKLNDNYAGRDVVIYWVSTESENPKSKNYASDEQLRTFAQKYAPGVKVLRDPEGAASRKLGADQLPSILILDKQGNLAGEPIRGYDPEANLSDQVGKQVDKIL